MRATRLGAGDMHDTDPRSLDGRSLCHMRSDYPGMRNVNWAGSMPGIENTLLDAIEDQLIYQPGVPTRHRKLLRENPLADWELRVGEYRVFYDIDDEPGIVMILAIGVKSHNTLRIEGEEIQL
jgi:mRNA-degrading endonuclease RelE of RelBE toxin-antitoxin system